MGVGLADIMTKKSCYLKLIFHCWYSESQCLDPLSKTLTTKGSRKEIADEPENIQNTNCFCINISR